MEGVYQPHRHNSATSVLSNARDEMHHSDRTLTVHNLSSKRRRPSVEQKEISIPAMYKSKSGSSSSEDRLDGEDILNRLDLGGRPSRLHQPSTQVTIMEIDVIDSSSSHHEDSKPSTSQSIDDNVLELTQLLGGTEGVESDEKGERVVNPPRKSRRQRSSDKADTEARYPLYKGPDAAIHRIATQREVRRINSKEYSSSKVSQTNNNDASSTTLLVPSKAAVEDAATGKKHLNVDVVVSPPTLRRRLGMRRSQSQHLTGREQRREARKEERSRRSRSIDAQQSSSHSSQANASSHSSSRTERSTRSRSFDAEQNSSQSSQANGTYSSSNDERSRPSRSIDAQQSKSKSSQANGTYSSSLEERSRRSRSIDAQQTTSSISNQENPVTSSKPASPSKLIRAGRKPVARTARLKRPYSMNVYTSDRHHEQPQDLRRVQSVPTPTTATTRRTRNKRNTTRENRRTRQRRPISSATDPLSKYLDANVQEEKVAISRSSVQSAGQNSNEGSDSGQVPSLSPPSEDGNDDFEVELAFANAHHDPTYLTPQLPKSRIYTPTKDPHLSPDYAEGYAEPLARRQDLATGATPAPYIQAPLPAPPLLRESATTEEHGTTLTEKSPRRRRRSPKKQIQKLASKIVKSSKTILDHESRKSSPRSLKSSKSMESSSLSALPDNTDGTRNESNNGSSDSQLHFKRNHDRRSLLKSWELHRRSSPDSPRIKKKNVLQKAKSKMAGLLQKKHSRDPKKPKVWGALEDSESFRPPPDELPNEEMGKDEERKTSTTAALGSTDAASGLLDRSSTQLDISGHASGSALPTISVMSPTLQQHADKALPTPPAEEDTRPPDEDKRPLPEDMAAPPPPLVHASQGRSLARRMRAKASEAHQKDVDAQPVRDQSSVARRSRTRNRGPKASSSSASPVKVRRHEPHAGTKTTADRRRSRSSGNEYERKPGREVRAALERHRLARARSRDAAKESSKDSNNLNQTPSETTGKYIPADETLAQKTQQPVLSHKPNTTLADVLNQANKASRSKRSSSPHGLRHRTSRSALDSSSRHTTKDGAYLSHSPGTYGGKVAKRREAMLRIRSARTFHEGFKLLDDHDDTKEDTNTTPAELLDRDHQSLRTTRSNGTAKSSKSARRRKQEKQQQRSKGRSQDNESPSLHDSLGSLSLEDLQSPRDIIKYPLEPRKHRESSEEEDNIADESLEDLVKKAKLKKKERDFAESSSLHDSTGSASTIDKSIRSAGINAEDISW